MNDNVYAPPETDIRQQGGSEGHDPALKDMSTKDLKKLFNHSNTIRTLIFLWCLGAVLMAIAGPILLVAGTTGKNASEMPIFGIIYLIGAVVQAAAIYGCWHRLPWGRRMGMIICVLSLPSFPIGTAIGIMGLMAFGKGKCLFGPDRLTHAQLKAEVAYRKAHNIR